MNLQYPPQMYLDKNGNPAGYDVMMLKALAKQMKVKLKIQNLDFNGLIPGLVSKKFDMVSVGLSATPERKKAISFSRPYVPVRAGPRRAGQTTPRLRRSRRGTTRTRRSPRCRGRPRSSG